MPKNPFTDVWQFLTGQTEDYLALGAWRYLVVALFFALLATSVVVAVRNWKEDPAQRTAVHAGTWVARVFIGCMWFEGMLWKLPLPVGSGLQFWTEQMATRAAFAFHRAFVTDVVLPNLRLLGPIVFLAELTFAASLILGLGVRLISVLAILFVLQLWLGIYIPGAPAEWSWSYIFLALVLFLFVLHGAGRSLGLDAWLRRHVPAVRDARGFLGGLFNLAG